MELRLSIEEIDYGGAALLLLPLAARPGEDAAARLLTAASKLPPELVRQVTEAVPGPELDAILSRLAEENEAKLLELIEGLARKNGVQLRAEALSYSPGRELRLRLSGIDYDALAALLLPALDRQHALPKALSSAALGLLGLASASTKERLALRLLPYAPAALESAAAKHGLRLKLGPITAEQTP